MSFFIGVFSLSGSPVRAHPKALEAAADLPDQFRLSRYLRLAAGLLHGDLDVLPEAGWMESDVAVGAAAGALLLGGSLERQRSGTSPRWHRRSPR